MILSGSGAGGCTIKTGKITTTTKFAKQMSNRVSRLAIKQKQSAIRSIYETSCLYIKSKKVYKV
jgi:hypothetical protein